MHFPFKLWLTGGAPITARQVDHEQFKERLVDDAMDAYVDWREECISVAEAYRRWESAPAADSRLAFAGYTAALDREEAAGERYAGLIARVGRLIADAAAPEGQEVRV